MVLQLLAYGIAGRNFDQFEASAHSVVGPTLAIRASLTFGSSCKVVQLMRLGYNLPCCYCGDNLFVVPFDFGVQ
jgi:hypothetical protein